MAAKNVKARTVFVCGECGYETVKWYGKCPECGAWNTFQEQIRHQTQGTPKGFSGGINMTGTIAGGALSNPAPSGNYITPKKLSDIQVDDQARYHTGLSELDRVLGGGIVQGSLILVGGDPGIGKSTLMLQICQHLGLSYSILYVSGEESERQIKLRANRLHVDSDNLSLVSLTDMESVIALITSLKPQIVIVDSIQTMTSGAISSAAGSITQVRECTQMLIHAAKTQDIPIFLIGHVNKDGAIAGPKVLEHMVDAVLYFEGDKHLSFRILRAVKNRYGSTNEIGVFEMGEEGLEQVENPSQLLLSGRPVNVSGTCVACTMEGTRPIMAEVQALCSKTGFGNPRRMATGFDYNRLNLLLAVLEKRGGLFFGNIDAYLNVVGGLELSEPASDLPVAMALISAYTNRAIPDDLFSFGELGLAGELRNVSHGRNRVMEAQRLGFTKCVLPIQEKRRLEKNENWSISLIGVANLGDLLRLMGGEWSQ